MTSPNPHLSSLSPNIVEHKTQTCCGVIMEVMLMLLLLFVMMMLQGSSRGRRGRGRRRQHSDDHLACLWLLEGDKEVVFFCPHEVGTLNHHAAH